MPNCDPIPTVLGEGKAYLNGKEYDLPLFCAPAPGDPFAEATGSDAVTPAAEVTERKLMPGDYISSEVRKSFMQAVSKTGEKSQSDDA
mgnify:CR=1 FL=1|jgi:hypothetical protein